MPMTKSEISKRLAERVGISKKQSDEYLEALAQLAYEEAKNTFNIPGLGKLVLVERPSREATMPFGLRKGEKYTIPAKKVVKFRLSKAAKDAIVGKEEPVHKAAPPAPAHEPSAPAPAHEPSAPTPEQEQHIP